MDVRKGTGKTGSNLFDTNLVFIVIFLACFGLVMIYSSSYYSAQLKFEGDGAHFLKRQALWVLGGILVMFFVSIIDYHIVKPFWGIGWLVSMALMLMVNFSPLGIERNGKKRWFGIGGHAIFQPAEVVKIALILVMAVLIEMSAKHLHTRASLARMAMMIFPPFVLVAMNNLSSGIIILGICFAMYMVATREKNTFWFALAGGIAIILLAKFATNGLVSTGLLQPYQVRRILVWNNPEAYPKNGGWQVLQGLYAIGSGGFFGKGLGNSVQKLGMIPEAQNDMIFAIICEELGLFGAICVMGIFLFMLYRFMIIASNAPDLFGSMLVIGVMAQIGIQVFMNIAVVTNFIPNTGVSLPFISYGGTSLLFLMAEVGLVLNVSRQIRFPD